MRLIPLLYIKLKFISLYIKLDFIFLLFIIPLVILFFINLFYCVYKDFKTRSKDLYQYKITNFFYTLIIIGLYIILFIFIIYGSRIIYINKTLDLKSLYHTICDLLINLMEIGFVFQLYYIFIFILFLLLLLFFIVNIQFLCSREFFKLHIFLYHTKSDKRLDFFRNKYTNLINTWGFHGCDKTDIISAYINYFTYILRWRAEKSIIKRITNTEKILYYILNRKYYRLMRHTEKTITRNINHLVSQIVNSKYYKWLFHLSPLLVIVYDCYFNHWILTHIFYFMLLYGPLVIIKRIIDCTFPLHSYTIEFFRSLYYNKHTYMICIPRAFKVPMIDMYLLNGLKKNTHKFELSAALDFSDQFDYIYMAANAYFLKDNYHPNRYTSTGDVSLIKMSDGKLYRIIHEYEEGKYELGEEWIVLEDKYNIEQPWITVEYEKEEEINMEEILAIIKNRSKNNATETDK